MAEADELRQVMSKKQKEKIPQYRDKFVRGAQETSGIERALAEEIFKSVEPFGGYGFNKSHSAAYGWIAYQTAYLKANHPLEYFTALMTSVKRIARINWPKYIDEARKLGIVVLPPDVNESLVDFAVVGDRIRFGLAAIKGAGEAAVRSVIDARDRGGPFVDLFDLAKRVDARHVNRRVFEALVKCGALDTLPGHRAAKLAALDAALELASRATRDHELGQASLFAESAGDSMTPKLPFAPEPSSRELLACAQEKESIARRIRVGPSAGIECRPVLVRMGATPLKELHSVEDDAVVKIAGIVTSARRTLTKSGQQILIAQIEDTTGSCEVIVFAKLSEQVQATFKPDAILVIVGRLRRRERRGATPGEDPPLDVSVSVVEVWPFVAPATRTAPVAPRSWHVDVAAREQIDRLAALMDEWPGEVPVVMHARGRRKRVGRGISADDRVRGELERIFGTPSVREAADVPGD